MGVASIEERALPAPTTNGRLVAAAGEPPPLLFVLFTIRQCYAITDDFGKQTPDAQDFKDNQSFHFMVHLAFGPNQTLFRDET